MRSRAQISSHPLHPILVAFPIGLWVTSLIFDLLGVGLDRPMLWSVGYYLAIAGIVGAVVAALPGAIDWFSVVPPASSAKKRGLIHAVLNITVLAIFVYESFYRGGPNFRPNVPSLVLSVIAVALLAGSGWLGGTLIYRNQIGVDHRYANAGVWKERSLSDWQKPVCNVGELAEGQMMLAHIESERVVVGRCSNGIVAFSDHCTHRGGSLADGALVGCTVQCPWHGSQFDVHSGRVVAGPATQKIKTYDVEMRSNEVYLKPSVTEIKVA